MSWSNHEISDYIDDLPMKISNSYMPKYFHIEIPEILSLKEDEDDYDFKIEKEAINMAEIAEEEKIKETERLLQSGTLKDFSKLKNYDDKHQPIDQTTSNLSPILPGSPCIPMLSNVPINGNISSLPSQSVVSPVSHHQLPPPPPTPLQQPSSVSNVMSTPLPVQLPLSIHGSIPGHQSYPSLNSAIVNSNTPSVINCSSTNNFNNVTKSISQGSSLVASSSSTTSSLPTPIPVNNINNFTTEADIRCNSKEMDLNNMKCNNNELNSVVIVRRNSVPTSLSTFQDNFGILRPSQINCDSSNNSNDDSRQPHHHHQHQHQHQHQQQHQHQHQHQQQQQQFIPKTRINPADFESSSSSPFDDALLRAIDDKQELNHVFQHY